MAIALIFAEKKEYPFNLESELVMKIDCNNLIIVKGVVIPYEWDKEGNVTGIAIARYNEMESPVLMDKTGRCLLALLHEKVVIRGKEVKRDKMDILEVKRFDKDSN